MSKRYRETLVKTIIGLDDFLEELNLDIVNLAMKGEFSEVDTLFEEGDVVCMHILDFEDVDDQNVQKLIKAYYMLSEVNASLRNTNAISDAEIRVANEEPDNYDDLPF